MKLREYQTTAVEFLTAPVRHRGFIVSPAGSGKTVIAAAAASKVAEPFGRVVVLCNTREQCEQARAAALKFRWPSPVCLDVHCVASRPDVTGADLVIIDESHHLPARTWWGAVAEADCIVWGFSATPWSGDWERDALLKTFFGEDNFHTVPRAEVQAGGSIMPGVVIVHDVDTEDEFEDRIAAEVAAALPARINSSPYIPKDEQIRRLRWQFTAEVIRTNRRRNARIVELANTSTDSTLILVSTVEHGEQLAAEIPGSLVVHAKIGKKKRAAAIGAFRDGSLRCMIATSLADEGLDVPRASVLILASGGRSAGKIEQRAGRVMRPHEGKERGTVHDFADRGCGLAHNQFKARARTYRKLGYKITNA